MPKKFKIAIVEANEFYNKTLVKYLQTLCDGFKLNHPSVVFEITPFLRASECLEMIEEDTSIILLDYFLESDGPGANSYSGLELLNSVRERCPKAEIIVVSEQKDIVMAVEMMKKGIYDYVDKRTNSKNRVGGLVSNIVREKLD